MGKRFLEHSHTPEYRSMIVFERSRPARAHRIMLMRILMRMCAQVQLYDRGWPAQHRQRHAARARPQKRRRWRDNKGRMAPHIVLRLSLCLS